MPPQGVLSTDLHIVTLFPEANTGRQSSNTRTNDQDIEAVSRNTICGGSIHFTRTISLCDGGAHIC